MPRKILRNSYLSLDETNPEFDSPPTYPLVHEDWKDAT